MAADARRALTTAYTALGYVARGHRYTGPELVVIRAVIEQGMGSLIGLDDALRHLQAIEQRYREADPPEVAPVEEQVDTVRAWGWTEREDGGWFPPSPDQGEVSAGPPGATEGEVSSPAPQRKPLSPDVMGVYVRQASNWLLSSVPEDAGPVHVSQLLRVAAELEGYVGQLVLEVLAARYRSGERVWTFSSTLEPTIQRLGESGLINWKSGTVEGTIIAWLTEAGKRATLSETYQPLASG